MKRLRPCHRFGIAVPLMLAVAGCAAIPAPQPPRAPVQVAAAPLPPPATPPTQPWDERALDPGVWRYDAAAQMASFAVTGTAAPLVTLACNGNSIRLTTTLGAGDQAMAVELKTSAGSDRLRFEGGSTTLPARDPRLDKIAFSRGRFALEASNGSALTLPVHSEIGRVIEDCRG